MSQILVTVTGPSTEVTVEEFPIQIEVGTSGPQGAQGPYGTLAVFSASGVLAPRVGLHRLYMEREATLAKVRAAVGVPAEGSSVVVAYLRNDIKLGEVEIAEGDATGVSVVSIEVNEGDFFTVDIEQVGSTFSGADLTVSLTLE